MRKIILQCAAVLFAGSLLQFWIFVYSPLSLPDNFPGTGINIKGVSLILWMVIVFVIFVKRYLRREEEVSLWDLLSIEVLAMLFSEIPLQLIRQLTYTEISPMEHVTEFFRSVIVMTVMAGVIGFFVAYQLKTRKTLNLIAIVLGILLLLTLVSFFFSIGG